MASLNYSKWETPADLRMVQTKSSRRVAVNKSFQQINEYVEKVNKERLETRQSLHLAKIHRQQQKRKNELKQFEEAQASVEIFLEVSTLTGDNALPEEKLREWYDQIRKDVIIGEAVQILEDLLAASY